jgi:hypothetical protein
MNEIDEQKLKSEVLIANKLFYDTPIKSLTINKFKKLINEDYTFETLGKKSWNGVPWSVASAVNKYTTKFNTKYINPMNFLALTAKERNNLPIILDGGEECKEYAKKWISEPSKEEDENDSVDYAKFHIAKHYGLINAEFEAKIKCSRNEVIRLETLMLLKDPPPELDILTSFSKSKSSIAAIKNFGEWRYKNELVKSKKKELRALGLENLEMYSDEYLQFVEEKTDQCKKIILSRCNINHIMLFIDKAVQDNKELMQFINNRIEREG